MLRTPIWATTWTVLRAVAAALIAVAVIVQADVTIGGAIGSGRDVGTTIANFFSFFTILSNVLSVIVLAWAVAWFWWRGRADAAPGSRTRSASEALPTRHVLPAAEPRALAIALASVTTYMLVTGIVYNTLLRGIQLPQGTTVPWSNEVLHVVGPLFLLADLLLGPRRRCLGWGAIGAVLGFPFAWVIYTMLRGPLATNPATGAPYWYPYPFLDPHSATTGGYLGVVVYVVAIAVGIAVVAALVIAVGRFRGKTRPDARTPASASTSASAESPRG
ncbi:hypothetical protein GCM10028798_21200 [Humibacter antri]